MKLIQAHTRTFPNKSENSKSSMIVNCIKRYIIYERIVREYSTRFSHKKRFSLDCYSVSSDIDPTAISVVNIFSQGS